MKIEARIFRFNAKRDYLNVYQPFVFHANAESTLLDLLEAFKQSDPLCFMRLDKIDGVRANGLGAKLSAPLRAIAPKGAEIVIEPLISDRAVLDLECDKRDFEDKFGVLEEFCDKDDRDYYNEFYIAYAVSPMRSLNSEYLGEALFMLADRLIGKNPPNVETIIKRISRAESGIFCFAGLNGVLLEGANRIIKTIERLWDLGVSMGFAPKNVSSAKFVAIETRDSSSFEGKKIAISLDCGAFGGAANIDDYERALKANGAKVLRLKNPWRFSGASAENVLPSAAIQAAKDLLLEAEDLGADTLVCAAIEARDFLNKNRRLVAEVAGRQIDIAIA
ncbi:MAG: DUF5644 domain-containing protein [Helicobacteraceae bacterium]|jgi:hypothetical protein|nr:DUF5644 domain-containing protein [Helicobacteraceae bacterium]